MMCEVQSPNGRYRLGEVVHGAEEDENGEIVEPATMPELAMAESVRLDVEGEVKDLGLGVIIVSVAWETDDGRRTMQRFLKYNVSVVGLLSMSNAARRSDRQALTLGQPPAGDQDADTPDAAPEHGPGPGQARGGVPRDLGSERRGGRDGL